MKERKKRLAPGLIALVIFLMIACLCSCSDSIGTEDGNTIQNETERVEQEKADSDGSETAKKEETDPDGSETAKKEETDPDGAETRKKEEADPDGRENKTEEETTNNKAEGEGEESPDTTETEMPDISGVTSVTYHEGGNALSDVLSGVTRSSVLDWLGLHREDDYYLGTPYPAQEDGTLIGGACGSTDRRNPNGDCASAYGNDDYESEAMLNCTGFVWHVLYKASGMTQEEAFSSIPCWGGVGAKDWISFLRNSNVEYRTYYGSEDSADTLIAAMIADGYMEPGDLIWTWGVGTVLASDGLPSRSADPHVGIYTGTCYGGEADEWWHSLGLSTATGIFYGENLYDRITPIAPCIAMTVIKLESP